MDTEKKEAGDEEEEEVHEREKWVNKIDFLLALLGKL